MNKLIIVILSLLLTPLACRTTQESPSDVKFYGKDSRRAYLQFESRVLLHVDPAHPIQPDSDEQTLRARYEADIDRVIRTQLAHLYGTLSQHTSPVDFLSNPGSPREDPYFEIKKVGIESDKSILVIDYQYSDTVIFSKTALNLAEQAEDTSFRIETDDGEYEWRKRKAWILKFDLPLDPGLWGERIYAQGCIPAKINEEKWTCAIGKNRCTDLHYQNVGDFWYFWNPRQKNEDSNLSEPKSCPIPQKSLRRIQALVSPQDNTGLGNATYPDYFRLYGEQNPRKMKRVYAHVLIGIDQSFKRDDEGAFGFYKLYDLLTHSGHSFLETEDEIACRDQRIESGNRDELCRFTAAEIKLFSERDGIRTLQFEDLYKSEKVMDPVATIKDLFGEDVPKTSPPNRRFLRYIDPQGQFEFLVRMQLFNPDSRKTLSERAKIGFKESDLLIYDGHSGLGWYFDMESLFKQGVILPKDKSQIYFFNGCSTFAYYNRDYFREKASSNDPDGKLFLDNITNAIGAPFLIGPGMDAVLIKHLASGAKPSWIRILDDMTGLSPEDSALTHVNGDEKNPRMPLPTGQCPEKYLYHAHSGFCRYIADPLVN